MIVKSANAAKLLHTISGLSTLPESLQWLVAFAVMIRSTVRSPSAEVGFRLERAYGVLAVLLMLIGSAHAAGIPKKCLDYGDKQQRAAVVLKKSPADQQDAWARGVIDCMEAIDRNFGVIEKGPDIIDVTLLQLVYDYACTGKDGAPLPRRRYERDYCEKKKWELDMIRQVQQIKQPTQ